MAEKAGATAPHRQKVAGWLIVAGALLVIVGIVNLVATRALTPSTGYINAAAMWAWYIAFLAGAGSLITGIVLRKRA